MRKALLIIITFFVYSLSGVFSKYASLYEPLSLYYLLFLGGVLVVLGLYAVLWQKVLAVMPLNKAFLCKSISIFFALLIARFLFGESITLNNIIGALIILSGLLVLSGETAES